jgi:hypothetical protein
MESVRCHQYRTCNGRRRPISCLCRRRLGPRRHPPLVGGRCHDRRRPGARPRRDYPDAGGGSWSSRAPRCSLCKPNAAARTPRALLVAGNGTAGGAWTWRSPRKHGGRLARAMETCGGVCWPSRSIERLYIHERTDRHGLDDGCTDVCANVATCHAKLVMRERSIQAIYGGNHACHMQTSASVKFDVTVSEHDGLLTGSTGIQFV